MLILRGALALEKSALYAPLYRAHMQPSQEPGRHGKKALPQGSSTCTFRGDFSGPGIARMAPPPTLRDHERQFARVVLKMLLVCKTLYNPPIWPSPPGRHLLRSRDLRPNELVRRSYRANHAPGRGRGLDYGGTRMVTFFNPIGRSSAAAIRRIMGLLRPGGILPGFPAATSPVFPEIAPATVGGNR